jgi:hypothetical protein
MDKRTRILGGALILLLVIVLPLFAQAAANQFLSWNGTKWVVAAPVTGGDITGALNAAKVDGLQGVPVAATAPVSGQTLSFNGTAWTPSNVGPLLAAGTITVANATTGAHTFASALPAGAFCGAGPQFDPATLPSLTFGVTNTTTSVTITLSAAGSGTFWFICTSAVN